MRTIRQAYLWGCGVLAAALGVLVTALVQLNGGA